MTDYLHALPPGYRIEEYELVRVLGSGGFGITYLGYDHHLDKAVAIKEYLPNDLALRAANQSVLPKSAQDKADYEWGLERFLTEAQTLARFDHRHIIKIHRFFRAHGTGYIVMEYAEGETLSEVLQRKGTLTEAELKAILLPILDGLEAVHRADFLHRDIKPGNIVIRDDGSPVLIDFGSARQAVAGKSRSVTAIVTPGYAPIEQYSAKGHQGPWTDIYGLGAVCYRCLAGEPPDDATERLWEDPLVPATKRCIGKANVSLLGAIDQALRVNEGERPQTIAAWRQVLADGGKIGKHTTRSVHKPVTRSAEEPAEARTGMSWSSLALVLVIVVLLGASAWQGWHLYRGMPGDGAGDTIAVEEEQTDTWTGDRATEERIRKKTLLTPEQLVEAKEAQEELVTFVKKHNLKGIGDLLRSSVEALSKGPNDNLKWTRTLRFMAQFRERYGEDWPRGFIRYLNRAEDYNKELGIGPKITKRDAQGNPIDFDDQNIGYVVADVIKREASLSKRLEEVQKTESFLQMPPRTNERTGKTTSQADKTLDTQEGNEVEATLGPDDESRAIARDPG